MSVLRNPIPWLCGLAMALGCGPGPAPKRATIGERERDLVITVVVPDGFSLRVPLLVGVAPVLPFDGRGVASTVIVPSPRATQPKGDAVLTLAPLRAPRPAWVSVHADLDGNGSVTERDALVALAGPVDAAEVRMVLDPFRVDLVCVKDEDDTRIERVLVTAVDAAAGRLVGDVAIAVETPGGSFTLPLGDKPHPPCPQGEYRARAKDPRLAPFSMQRAIDLVYPQGDVVVKMMQTPTQCRDASARVKTASRSGGPPSLAIASVDCTLLEWKPLAGENFALLGIRSPRASLFDVGTSTPLASVRRPAVAGSLVFDRPGAYELELYIGRATLGRAGGGYGLVRHVERVE